METFIIAFVVIISILYVGMQHLYNWGIRKTVKAELEQLGLLITIVYFILTLFYWYSLIQAFKLIL